MWFININKYIFARDMWYAKLIYQNKNDRSR